MYDGNRIHKFLLNTFFSISIFFQKYQENGMSVSVHGKPTQFLGLQVGNGNSLDLGKTLMSLQQSQYA